MNAFTADVAERLRGYVYRLEDPRTGRTFYVGKGRGDRVFAHARQAIDGEDGLRYDRIREIVASGLSPTIVIHRHGLEDDAALEVEAALIDAFSRDDLANGVRGHGSERGCMSPEDIVTLYGAQPADITVAAIAIKIEHQWHADLTPEQLYERTRRYWVCNPERRPIPPRVALCVARGIIREVYEIERWEEYPDMEAEVLDPTRRPAKVESKTKVRRGFIGTVADLDSALRATLVGKSVRHIAFGSGSPIAYAGPGADRPGNAAIPEHPTRG